MRLGSLNKALEGLTFEKMEPLTIHDLRRTGATLLTEKGFNRDVIEKALAHEHEGIRAVYIIAEYAEQRKEMLQWWADYVSGLLNGSKVIVDQGDDLRYQIVIDCDNEAAQTSMPDRFECEGIKCRPLIS